MNALAVLEYILILNGLLHLRGGYYMLWKIVATVQTYYRQSTCSHGPWLKDFFTLIPNNESAHCKKCWKIANQSAVLCRIETKEEYVERASEGGLYPRKLAEDTYDSFFTLIRDRS